MDYILVVLCVALVLNWFWIPNRAACTVLIAIGKDAMFPYKNCFRCNNFLIWIQDIC